MRRVLLDNPFDLRPAAAAIIAAIDEKLSKMTGDEPLYVVIGESHDRPSHILLQYLLASRLLDRKNEDSSKTFAFGYEGPNILEKILKPIQNSNIQDHIIKTDTGEKSLRLSLTTNSFSEAQSSKSIDNLNLFLYFNRIAFSFNDVPRQLFEHDPKSELAETMHMRNKAIIDNATEHATRVRPQIYIQQCGMAHLIGAKKSVYSSSQSLCGILKEKNLEFLPVFIGADKIYDPENSEFKQDALCIENISDINITDPKAPYSEQGLIDKIVRESGCEITAWDIKKYKTALKNNLIPDIRSWVQEAYKLTLPY